MNKIDFLRESLGDDEVRLVKTNIYEWREILFELLRDDEYKPGKIRKGKAGSSHYVMIKRGGHTFWLRELGEQSKKYQELNDE
jgi:hypothetical protein